MNVSDFDYYLPESQIAQTPIEPRDAARMMLLDRATGKREHCEFRDIVALINPGDALVLNTTRVLPARLFAKKTNTGGKVEILLLRQLDATHWRALVGGKRVAEGTELTLAGDDTIRAQVTMEHERAERTIAFSQPINELVTQIGQIPLPPYIHQPLADPERYQTLFSRHEGSAAAPTAGLHFTPEVLLALRAKGVHLAHCLLHIGLDTFQPVYAQQVEQHKIHSEYASLSAQDARIINDAKLAGGRIIAVGTTVARTLETAALLSSGCDPAQPASKVDMCPWRPVVAFQQDTNLFIYPGYRWRVVDALLTNFHLPRSTLLMMVSAFAGRERLLESYEIAKQSGYRFYSFGDAMFIQ